MKIEIGKEIKAAAKAFPYIYAWHNNSGSMDYYIIDLAKRAEADGAPADAIYHDGQEWRCMSDLPTDHQMRPSLEATAAKFK